MRSALTTEAEVKLSDQKKQTLNFCLAAESSHFCGVPGTSQFSQELTLFQYL